MSRGQTLAGAAVGTGILAIGCVWPLLFIGFWGLVAAALAKYVFGWSPFG